MTRIRLNAPDRRNQIIEKAAPVFAEYGLNGTKSRDIAKACDVTEAVIYSHFETKLDLYKAVCEKRYSETVGKWRKISVRESIGANALKSLLKSEITVMSANPDLCSTIIHSIGASIYEQTIGKMVSRWLSELHSLVIETLNHGIKDGSLAKDTDPECAAHMIRGIVWLHIINVALKLKALENAKYPFDMFDCPLRSIGALKPEESLADWK